MPTVIAISGSLRKASFNTALLRAAQELAPDDMEIEPVSIRDIPLYDGDLEAEEGVPEAVETLKARIARGDALLIVTPEYNGGVPGVLKNAIDWLSRPPADIAKVFRGRPVGVIGATPGRLGTALAQAALLPSLRNLGTIPFTGKLVYVAGAGDRFEDGALTDEKTREVLAGYLEAFQRFIRQVQG